MARKDSSVVSRYRKPRNAAEFTKMVRIMLLDGAGVFTGGGFSPASVSHGVEYEDILVQLEDDSELECWVLTSEAASQIQAALKIAAKFGIRSPIVEN